MLSKSTLVLATSWDEKISSSCGTGGRTSWGGTLSWPCAMTTCVTSVMSVSFLWWVPDVARQAGSETVIFLFPLEDRLVFWFPLGGPTKKNFSTLIILAASYFFIILSRWGIITESRWRPRRFFLSIFFRFVLSESNKYPSAFNLRNTFIVLICRKTEWEITTIARETLPTSTSTGSRLYFYDDLKDAPETRRNLLCGVRLTLVETIDDDDDDMMMMMMRISFSDDENESIYSIQE